VQGDGHCLVVLPQLGGLSNKLRYRQSVMGVLALPAAGFLVKLLN
jgi:hypothetical protein